MKRIWTGRDWLFGLICFFLVGLCGLAATHIHSFDIFWQLQSGRYLLETGSFVRTDLFTLAPDVHRFEHCWLHDVLFYLVWTLGGYSAISLAKALLLAATAICLIVVARIRTSSWIAILCCLPLFLLTSSGWLARPQLWTFLGFALTVLILEQFMAGRRWWLYLLLPVGFLWANLHAGSILILALFLAYLVGESGALVGLNSRLSRRAYSWLWVALAGVLVAVSLTPYIDDWYRTLMMSPRLGVQKDSAGQLSGSIQALFNMDWRPTDFRQDAWFYYAMIGSGVTLLLGWRRLKLRDVCLLAGLSIMGLKLSRHTTFLFFGMIALLPTYLDACAEPFFRRLKNSRGVLVLKGLLACLALGGALVVAEPIYQQSGWFNPGLRAWHYPVAATEFIKNNQLPKNLYNTYDWGGYLAWRLFPDYSVFWDGRQNSGEMFRLGWNVMAGKEEWDNILLEYEVNTIVTRCLTLDTGERYPLLDRLRENEEWALVFAGEASLVFVRARLMSDAWLTKNVLPKEQIDRTIRSEAALSLAVNRWRYKAWWELARLDLQERRYPEAFANLENYLSRAPGADPVAENYYRMLYPLYKNKGAENGQ